MLWVSTGGGRWWGRVRFGAIGAASCLLCPLGTWLRGCWHDWQGICLCWRWLQSHSKVPVPYCLLHMCLTHPKLPPQLGNVPSTSPYLFSYLVKYKARIPDRVHEPGSHLLTEFRQQIGQRCFVSVAEFLGSLLSSLCSLHGTLQGQHSTAVAHPSDRCWN